MKTLSSAIQRNIALVCRLVLGITFIFSGLSKTVDPWGTAIKINEYFAIYGVESLKPASMLLSIWLCGAELMMGCMLTFGVRIRLISIFAFCAMSFFTVLTFLSATVIPVEDCGCFGDAIKLTPWQTFFKNLVLLPLAVVVWRYHRGGRLLSFSPLEILLTLLFFLLSMGLGFYSFRHLPPVDFLPYKVGVNIAAEMRQSATVEPEEIETVLVYRNRQTGREREFSVDDTAWHDDTKWEWVATQTDAPVMHTSLIEEFSLRTFDGQDATADVLSTPGRLYLLCVTDLTAIPPACMRRLENLVGRAALDGARVVCLSPSPLAASRYRFGQAPSVETLSIDASTMKTMLRASVGVVVLQDGTIVDKRNCRDVAPLRKGF